MSSSLTGGSHNAFSQVDSLLFAVGARSSTPGPFIAGGGRIAALSLWCFTVAACADRVVAPSASDASPMGRSNGTGDPAVINFGSAASAQENTCTVRTFTVDARGKSVVTSSRTQPSNVKKVGKDSVLKGLWLVHFDPVTRKPQEDLKCVMPEGKAARQWISEYTSSRGRNGNSPLLSDAGVAVANSSFGVGTWCSTFGSPECGVTWMCDGIECAGSVQLRAPDGRTKHRGGRTAAVSGGGFGGTFYCTGAGEGCFLSVTDYGDGTAEIYLGGSCAAEGGGDGGGSGGPPEPPVCPSTDPRCFVPLNANDSTAIAGAIAYLRPYASIVDPGHRNVCEAMFNRFISAYQNNKIFRGLYDSEGRDAHYGETYDGKVHIDPSYLATALLSADGKRNLLTVLLHEAGHLLDYPNHVGRPPFTTFPWSLLTDISPHTNICVG